MKYTMSVLVENHAGVLSKVSGLFSRRGFNIDSLAVGVTEDPAISRMTIVVDGDEYTVEQLEKQLNKVIPVIKVKTLREGDYIPRTLSLIKVSVSAGHRALRHKGNRAHRHYRHRKGSGSHPDSQKGRRLISPLSIPDGYGYPGIPGPVFHKFCRQSGTGGILQWQKSITRTTAISAY